MFLEGKCGSQFEVGWIERSEGDGIISGEKRSQLVIQYFNKMYHLKVKWQAVSAPNMTYLKMLITFVEKDILNPDYAVFLFYWFKHSKNLPEAGCWERG